MEINAFTAGVIPGGLKNQTDIKLLICYLLWAIKTPIQLDLAVEALTSEGLVNYFEANEAFNNQINQENIKVADKKNDVSLYTVTEKGAEIAKTLERDLPLSVREKAVRAAMRLMAMQKREEGTEVLITKVSDGYQVTCKILDINSDLLSTTLFVPDISHAELVKKQFLNDPTLLYTGILNILLGNLDALKNLEPSPNNDLF